jgi:hypothetical protein
VDVKKVPLVVVLMDVLLKTMPLDQIVVVHQLNLVVVASSLRVRPSVQQPKALSLHPQLVHVLSVQAVTSSPQHPYSL